MAKWCPAQDVAPGARSSDARLRCQVRLALCLWLAVSGWGLAPHGALGQGRDTVGQPQPAVSAEAKRLSEQVIKLYGEGRYDEALPLAERALALYEKALGSDHPHVATALSNLALLYAEKGDYAKAEPLYLRSLAIKEKAVGPDHPSVAISLNNLASLYFATGDYARTEPLHLRALALNEKALGPDQPEVANSLNNLA